MCSFMFSARRIELLDIDRSRCNVESSWFLGFSQLLTPCFFLLLLQNHSIAFVGIEHRAVRFSLRGYLL